LRYKYFLFIIIESINIKNNIICALNIMIFIIIQSINIDNTIIWDINIIIFITIELIIFRTQIIICLILILSTIIKIKIFIRKIIIFRNSKLNSPGLKDPRKLGPDARQICTGHRASQP